MSFLKPEKNRKHILSQDMFYVYPIKNVNQTTGLEIKENSVNFPDSLIGWQVEFNKI
jgi:hypothetical protein